MKEWKWLVLLLLAAAVWGSTFALMKDLLSSLDTFALLSFRFGMATIVLAAYFVAVRKRLSKDEIWQGFLLGLLLFAVFFTQVYGLNFTSATNSALITGLYVIFTPVLAALVLRNVPSRRIQVAVLLSFLGLWLLTGASTSFNIGDAFTLLTAIFVAANLIYASKYVQKSDPLSLVLVQMATTAALSIVLMLAHGTAPKALPPIGILGALAYLAIFATVLAYLAVTHAQKEIDSSKVALILIMEPVFAAIFGVLMLHEPLGINQLFGGGAIIAAMLIAESKERGAPKPLVDTVK